VDDSPDDHGAIDRHAAARGRAEWLASRGIARLRAAARGSYVAFGRGRRIVSIAPSAGRPKDAMLMPEAIAILRAVLAA